MGLEGALTTPSTCTSARLVTGCDGMVMCEVIHSNRKEQFYEGKRQTDNSIVMYKCQGCIIQILSQYFRIFLGYRVLASKTYPIFQVRVEK